MTTATEPQPTLAQQWRDKVTGKWLPLNPDWDVIMLQPGEKLRLGDFKITEGEALYRTFGLGEPVETAGVYFRYSCNLLSHVPPSDEEILEFVFSQLDQMEIDRREKQHQARLALAELAAEYRSITGQASRAAWRKVILDTIARSDFGCRVKFDETTGNVIFYEDGE